MRRTWPILMATTALLMGCSSGDSTPITVTVTETPSTAPSVVADPVDPTEVGFFSEQFHPCEVFTEAQLQKAGLGERLRTTGNPESVVKSCGFAPIDLDAWKGSFLVATDQVDREHLSELALETFYWDESKTDGIYIHQMPGEVRECTAAVDYEWGRFLVGYRELGQGWEPEVLCADSVSILKSLISEAGGVYGNQS